MSDPVFRRGHYENIEQREIRAFSITHIEIGIEVSKNKSRFFYYGDLAWERAYLNIFILLT